MGWKEFPSTSCLFDSQFLLAPFHTGGNGFLGSSVVGDEPWAVVPA